MQGREWLVGARFRAVLTARLGVVCTVGLGVVFAAALAFQAFRIAQSWGGAWWWFGCGAGAVVCGLALARRHARLRTAIAGLVVAGAAVVVARPFGLPAEPGPAMAMGMCVLVASAVRMLPVWQAGAVAGGGLAVVAGSLLSFANPAAGMLAGLGWPAAVVAGVWPRLLAVRRRAAAERVRRHERLVLARELHDIVAHHITSVVLQAQAAQVVARRHPDRTESSLAEIEVAGADALAATRRVVGLLRDAQDVTVAAPGLEQLSDLVERFDHRGCEVRLRVPGDEWAVPPEVAGTVYRVVQEALTNISRHAPKARLVTVGVARDREAVTVEVVDDAPHGRSVRKGGYGLVGMRERLEALGGTLSAGPRPGTGWAVIATLPITARERR
ncbi:sensor histidine kinase [Nonomuraea sp. NPDC046802]|uniref:sensor histidine kinase n=1 Tax=Nonomuraea sp. NPDC046802 TaxID=3154919 RepID=UPI0033DBE53A